MKRVLTIIFLSLGFTVNAQDFKKSNFRLTDWFTDNKDSLFFKTDTVKFIKRSNKVPEWSTGYAENEMDYLGHGDYINLKFNKNGKLEYWVTYNNYINMTPLQEYSWKFNGKRNTILVFKKSDLLYELKPSSKRKIKIDSKFANQETLITEEVTFVKLK